MFEHAIGQEEAIMLQTEHIRTVDLAKLRRNVALLRKQTPASARLMAVVKADAYGHGMEQVARAALQSGADALAVALVAEGCTLRQAGVDAPILVLGAASRQEMTDAVRCGLTLAVCGEEMIRDAEEAAREAQGTCLVHLKVETGMNRIGAATQEDIAAVLQALEACPHVRLTGAFTHFADADGDDLAYTRMQYERFMALTAFLPEGIIRHCANSAAIHRLPEYSLDMVRAGISMYGYPPVASDLQLEPVMDWHTYVTFVKTIARGETVGYGRTYTADKPMRVATIACGYGDGYHRAVSGKGEVLIASRRAKLIGRICMDQMMADVTDIPDVAPGTKVTLMGRDGDETITAEDLAAWAGTISYEVLLAATGRVKRVWIHA